MHSEHTRRKVKPCSLRRFLEEFYEVSLRVLELVKSTSGLLASKAGFQILVQIIRRDWRLARTNAGRGPQSAPCAQPVNLDCDCVMDTVDVEHQEDLAAFGVAAESVHEVVRRGHVALELVAPPHLAESATYPRYHELPSLDRNMPSRETAALLRDIAKQVHSRELRNWPFAQTNRSRRSRLMGRSAHGTDNDTRVLCYTSHRNHFDNCYRTGSNYLLAPDKAVKYPLRHHHPKRL